MNYDCKAEGISKIIRNYELADAKAYIKNIVNEKDLIVIIK